MNSYILVDRPFMMLIPGRAYSCPHNPVIKTAHWCRTSDELNQP